MRASLRRDSRGAVFPSPVVILSIVAVAMAAFAFVATRDSGTPEREITPAARSTAAPSPSATPAASPSATRTPKPKPAVQRSSINVEVYNNSAIKGLAASASARVSDAGWKAVGADNWYGTIPTTTVYYPPRLARAAKLLAADLGVRRTAPAVDPMRMDRLTLILTAPLPQR